MSTKVKCNSCNIVIDEVLAFISNKIDVMDEEAIIRICESAFSESDIVNGKNLLFESIPASKKKTRKRKGKTLRDIEDIICLLKETDPEVIPIFVARELQKLPPVLFDHLDATRILKDLVRLRQDVDRITHEYATLKDVESLKSDLTRKPFTCNDPSLDSKQPGTGLFNSFEYNSGPNNNNNLPRNSNQSAEKYHKEVGISLRATSRAVDNIFKSDASAVSDAVARERLPKRAERVPKPTSHGPPPPLPSLSHALSRSLALTRTFVDESPSVPSVAPEQLPSGVERNPKSPSCRSTSPLPSLSLPLPRTSVAESPSDTSVAEQAPTDKRLILSDTKSFSNVTKEGEWKKPVFSDEWKEVQRKRLRNRFSGNKGIAENLTENNFKAADIKIPIYVYNVSKDTTETDISKYIFNKVNLNVELIKWKMKIDKNYNAFKIFVPQEKISVFLCDEFWPQGVSFRRFINIRQRKEPSTMEKNYLESE